jgi:hypothetical protein
MPIQVRRSSERREDRAGDPFEGLVNLFELGVVLAVGFMLAALSALGVEERLSGRDDEAVEVRSEKRPKEVELTGRHHKGKGVPLGRAYRLEDGSTVVVRDP